MSDITLWRMHLRPRDVDHREVVRHCLENRVVGIGWAVDGYPNTPEEYAEMATEKHRDGSNPSPAIAFATQINIGDLIWSRHPDGTYYLGRIGSDWRYSKSEEHIDIPNQRECEWLEGELKMLFPGK